MNIYTIRLTPNPIQQPSTQYKEQQLIDLFRDTEKFLKVLIFQEDKPLHYHIRIETTYCQQSVSNIISTKCPLLKGNAYKAIHPVLHKGKPCRKIKHNKGGTCAHKSKTYVAKDGNLTFSFGYTQDEINLYIKEGSSHRKGIRQPIYQLITDGMSFPFSPSDVIRKIKLFYEEQKKPVPQTAMMFTMIHKVYSIHPKTRKQYNNRLTEKVSSAFQHHLDLICFYNDFN